MVSEENFLLLAQQGALRYNAPGTNRWSSSGRLPQSGKTGEERLDVLPSDKGRSKSSPIDFPFPHLEERFFFGRRARSCLEEVPLGTERPGETDLIGRGDSTRTDPNRPRDH